MIKECHGTVYAAPVERCRGAILEPILADLEKARLTGADIEIILQRAAVQRQGLQGVHPDLVHDARPGFAVLPAIEWEDRAHPARNAAVAAKVNDAARRLVAGYVSY